MAKIESSDVLETALNLVTGNRQKQNGDKSKNHQNIANMWTAYLTNEFGREIFIRADMVANMMVLLKVARTQAGKFNKDDYVDACGYAAIAGEIKSEDTYGE
tara:strand:- start:46 stop:351 length:306 start_codon:yes stop_codon:yes gene_type:complete